MISLVFDMSIKTKIVSIHPYMIYFYVYGYAFSLFISLVTGWLVIKEVSSTIFIVFGMMRPGIEPRSPGPLANTLPTKPMSWFIHINGSISNNSV